MFWWWVNARHVTQHGHFPEWERYDPFYVCIKCTRGGRRAGVTVVLARAFKMGWST